MAAAKHKPPKNAWRPGQSGNPAGKPAGARNKATQMVLALMEGGAKEITNVIIKAAKGGDLNAAKLVLDRLAPPMRERAVSISFPDTATAEGLGLAQQAILDGVGSGALLPGEATALASIVESRRKTLDTIDFERRLQRLEEKLAANKGSVA